MIKDLIDAIVSGKEYNEAFDKEFNVILTNKLNELKTVVQGRLFEKTGCHAEGSEEEIPETRNGKVILVKKKVKVTENLDIDQEETLDEGIVTGSNSRVYSKKTGKAKYSLNLTDRDGKEHSIYSVSDKDENEESARKAANSMGRALAKKYGVKHWNESEEETMEFDETIVEAIEASLGE